MNSTQAKQTSGTSTHRARDGGVDLGTTEETPTLMLVFEAIRQIHDAGGEPTRERIVAMTGLKPTTVDDRIKVLRGEGMISPLKQCYRPLHQHVAAQAVSCTAMADGVLKIEKGDQLLTLVPAEARQLGSMLAGKALEPLHWSACMKWKPAWWRWPNRSGMLSVGTRPSGQLSRAIRRSKALS